MRDRLNVSLPVAMISQIGDLAARRKVTRSAVVETAVASLLSPDSAEKTEAALTRRLDRLTRQMQRQERDLMIALETHALFIRFWLGQMPPLPAEAQAAANALGQERFARFLDTLGRRLSQGRSFRDDIPLDIPAMRQTAPAPAPAPGKDASSS
ncbi:CopG family transcriptional regulator [Acetobacter sp. DmW_125133]|uniref:CopG family transcriptional regulator n=3 Tax=Acetobacteraceae TaxID=433 RepID=A0AAN1U7Z7_9PROT|nr:CopG family transcriptional regulator [Acetobacter oryzifermentans]AXM99272.1 CopG family transcriptional regulator [Acetobacter pomorum]KAA8391334.1 CopG family transcriptional regulator [Acetobacter sp. DmW_125124]KAA8393668.1 CopG family transcriptional regulator [Acetobacter sp. DmW_125128]KAA8395170.1 CopG family transcriptional regulator [Acetobacter sp. DmW_125127]KAA8403500.1 CopG family transcriptional regulator [Acetobacter sp. DmW_125134]KAA8403786.1 CopG family transcriptional 